jgi:hypothetical protein
MLNYYCHTLVCTRRLRAFNAVLGICMYTAACCGQHTAADSCYYVRSTFDKLLLVHDVLLLLVHYALLLLLQAMSIKLPRSLTHSITALACASCGKLTTLLAVGTATGQIAVWLLKNTVTASGSSSSSSPKRSSPKNSSDAPILFRLLDQVSFQLWHTTLNAFVRKFLVVSAVQYCT